MLHRTTKSPTPWFPRPGSVEAAPLAGSKHRSVVPRADAGSHRPVDMPPLLQPPCHAQCQPLFAAAPMPRPVPAGIQAECLRARAFVMINCGCLLRQNLAISPWQGTQRSETAAAAGCSLFAACQWLITT
jgi:hypothetical protein